MKDYFSSLFGQEQKPRQEPKPAAPVRRDAPRQEGAELYKKGDVIGGKYEVHRTLAWIFAQTDRLTLGLRARTKSGALAESDSQLVIVPPGDRDFLLAYTRGDQQGVVSPFG